MDIHATPSAEPAVLLVDDEPRILFSAKVWLNSSGIRNVLTLDRGEQLMALLAREAVGAMVLDLAMPAPSGLELLPQVVEHHPQVPVIIMTASQDLESAVSCMKAGAFDYLVKPVEPNRFVTTIKNALQLRSLTREVATLSGQLKAGQLHNPSVFSSIITRNAQMRGIFQYLEAVAPSGQPVLITGETGVGKELVARAVHALSRRPGPFIGENVAGLDDTLFSDTLLGHRKGAFSSAEQARTGLIGLASGGTLFLDEIGDLSIASQVKLLRLLQEDHYYPLGAEAPVPMTARMVVATNCNLKRAMAEGRFRTDLFYRLSAHHVHLPPLRHRREDIPLLVHHFLDQAARLLNKRRPTPPPELFPLLAAYALPGNVRELKAMIFDAVARHEGGVLSLKSFQQTIRGDAFPAESAPAAPVENSALHIHESGFPTLKEAEEVVIQEALRRACGKQSVAASLLGISRQALNRRLRLNPGLADRHEGAPPPMKVKGDLFG